MSRSILLTCCLCLLAGCEQTNVGAGTGGGDGLLAYMSSMDSVRISFSVISRHYRYEKQSALDPATIVTFDGERNYWFSNYDSASTLEWVDTGFSAKAKFGFRQFTPFPNEYYYPNASTSIMAGYYDEPTQTLRDVRCVLKYYKPLTAGDFQMANASLSINEMKQGAISADSVEFFATGRELKDVVTLGFSSEDNFYNGDYIKRTRLDSIMWEDPTFDPILRVVFYSTE